MWTYARRSFGEPHRYADTRLSYCMYGKPYKKVTRLRVWRLTLAPLGLICVKGGGQELMRQGQT